MESDVKPTQAGIISPVSGMLLPSLAPGSWLGCLRGPPKTPGVAPKGRKCFGERTLYGGPRAHPEHQRAEEHPHRPPSASTNKTHAAQDAEINGLHVPQRFPCLFLRPALTLTLEPATHCFILHTVHFCPSPRNPGALRKRRQCSTQMKPRSSLRDSAQPFSD